MCQRRVQTDLPSPLLGDVYTPPKPPTPRPMRYVLKVAHSQFLLPPGLGVQEAAALAYMLGQSRRIESRYRDGRTDWSPQNNEQAEIALTIIDPKEIVEPAKEDTA